MFALFRIGRFALRASATRGPKQPPQEYSWFGKLVATAFLIGIPLALNWRATVIVLGIGVTVSVLIAAFAIGNARDKRLRGPDSLDKAMADLKAGERK